jgi:hypothetical protein
VFERETHRLLHEILVELRHIRHELRPKHATFARLYIIDSKGNRLMPAQLLIGQTATAVLHEFVSQGGAELAPIGPVSYSSSDPTIATVDPASGLITAVAPGTATITGLDGGNSLTASDSVSDTPLVATVATLVITPTVAIPPTVPIVPS